MPKKKEQPAAITSLDVRKEILDKLKAVYPPLFSDEGNLNKGELDALLKDFDVSDIAKFEFRWAGKMGSKKTAFTPSKARLQADPKRSVDFDDTQNVIIEGENLEVLKLLQKSYYGKVKCIYIDPPYNTGHDFVYSDDYSEDKKAYWEQSGTLEGGVRVDTNTESVGRYHSNWLNMMQARLLVAHQLLTNDGLIFISISDDEVHHLRKLLDEVFGEDNFIGDIIWNSTKSVTNTALISVSHTHNLVYARNKEYFVKNRHHFRLPEPGEGFSNPDNDPRGPWKADPFQVGGFRPNQQYKITNPKTGQVYSPTPGNSWKNELSVFQQLIADNRIVFGVSGEAGPQRKRFQSEAEERGRVAKTLWDDVDTTTNATTALKEMFEGKNVFDNPKPVDLIKRFIQLGVHDPDNAIILDFFGGSGTTGHAVMELNKEDNGKRKFLMVQLPETIDEKDEAFAAGYKKISDVTIERVRRAGKLIKKEKPETDTGFKVFKLTTSLFPENTFVPDPKKSKEENLEALEQHIAKSKQKLLIDFDKGDLLYEAMLKDGFELNFKAERLPDFAKNEVFKVSDGSKEALVCLDQTLQDATVKALEAHKNSRFICLHRAVDTTKKWGLDKIFGDSLSLI